MCNWIWMLESSQQQACAHDKFTEWLQWTWPLMCKCAPRLPKYHRIIMNHRYPPHAKHDIYSQVYPPEPASAGEEGMSHKANILPVRRCLTVRLGCDTNKSARKVTYEHKHNITFLLTQGDTSIVWICSLFGVWISRSHTFCVLLDGETGLRFSCQEAAKATWPSIWKWVIWKKLDKWQKEPWNMWLG